MEDNIGFWMDAIKNALNIDSLTREILSAFIDHIVVYEREKVDGENPQRVEIFYKFVVTCPVHLSRKTARRSRALPDKVKGLITQLV